MESIVTHQHVGHLNEDSEEKIRYKNFWFCRIMKIYNFTFFHLRCLGVIKMVIIDRAH